MAVRNHFSEEDLRKIRAATREVEQHTAGELVCVLADRVSEYEEALWIGATAGALSAALAAGLGHIWLEVWSEPTLAWITLPAAFGAAVAYLVVRSWAGLRRALIPGETLDRRVGRQAATAFLDEGVFATRGRTGVLIFVALFEHRVAILVDEGLREQVPEGAWKEISDRLAAGLRGQRAGKAVVEAVEACGHLLEEHGVDRRSDDRNELDDRPRLYDE